MPYFEYLCEYCQSLNLPSTFQIEQKATEKLLSKCGSYCQLYGGNLQDQIGKGTLKKLGLVEEPTVDTGIKA
jgi:hypothetical protein|tara:strand:- start:487 stop:702 length:216 start_codon:yes stop_codon:yes gene_type:complete